jgi:PEP-CTERM motif
MPTSGRQNSRLFLLLTRTCLQHIGSRRFLLQPEQGSQRLSLQVFVFKEFFFLARSLLIVIRHSPHYAQHHLTEHTMKKTLLSLAAVAFSATAAASTFTINNGVDFQFPANGSTLTSLIGELGYTGTLATSIYLGNPAVAGTTVIDTNQASVMNFYGFAAGAQTSLGGTPLNFNFPSNPGNLNINALNNVPAVTDTNGFVSGEGFPGYGQFGSWGLTYDYTIVGVTTGSAVNFTSGYFNVYYQSGAGNPNNGEQVLRLNLTGSEFQGVNLSLTGNMSFDFDGNGSDDSTAFSRNFWASANGVSFYNSWLAAPGNLTWEIDTNVNPPIPTVNQLWAAPTGALFRQSTLDGSITLNVPEPGSLALLGLALAGMGFAQRRRNQSI